MIKSGWIGTMGQSEDRDFKVIPTAVSTWGPRIPPAVGTFLIYFNKFSFLFLLIFNCTSIRDFFSRTVKPIALDSQSKAIIEKNYNQLFVKRKKNAINYL